MSVVEPAVAGDNRANRPPPRSTSHAANTGCDDESTWTTVPDADLPRVADPMEQTDPDAAARRIVRFDDQQIGRHVACSMDDGHVEHGRRERVRRIDSAGCKHRPDGGGRKSADQRREGEARPRQRPRESSYAEPVRDADHRGMVRQGRRPSAGGSLGTMSPNQSPAEDRSGRSPRPTTSRLSPGATSMAAAGAALGSSLLHSSSVFSRLAAAWCPATPPSLPRPISRASSTSFSSAG